MVLSTLFIALLVSNIILRVILSQSRLTHHQVSRTQAYYAALAGINYALEMLRTSNPQWPRVGSYNRTICNTNPNCVVTLPVGTVCNATEANFPCSVDLVTISVGDPGSGNTRRVNATSNYTYQ